MLPILLGDKMGTARYCYIVNQFYLDYPHLKNILDEFDESKHNVRTHLCLNLKYNNCNVLVPLRKKLGEPVRAFGRIGFSVPSQSKPNAGLDYRYTMIINNPKYFRYDTPRITNIQQLIINENYNIIQKQVIEYIDSYVKVANKDRVDKTARFRVSSLINFNSELNVRLKTP